jgi:hypothetical protein
VFAVGHAGSILLTCDTRLLRVAASYDVQRACFKTAIAYANQCFGNGVFDDDAFDTDAMHTAGAHPFFHYGNDKLCPQCDPRWECDVRRDQQKSGRR